MKDKLYLTIKREETVDPHKVEIRDIDNPYFWKHHGHTLEDKELLRNACKQMNTINNKIKKQIPLTETERLYNQIYNSQKIVLSKSYYGDNYTLSDGRHRMAMCQEENVFLNLQVNYFF